MDLETEMVWASERIGDRLVLSSTLASVKLVASDGSPWVGVVRRVQQGWRATSTLYAAPADLGVFDTPEIAHARVDEECRALAARRGYVHEARP